MKKKNDRKNNEDTVIFDVLNEENKKSPNVSQEESNTGKQTKEKNKEEMISEAMASAKNQIESEGENAENKEDIEAEMSEELEAALLLNELSDENQKEASSANESEEFRIDGAHVQRVEEDSSMEEDSPRKKRRIAAYIFSLAAILLLMVVSTVGVIAAYGKWYVPELPVPPVNTQNPDSSSEDSTSKISGSSDEESNSSSDSESTSDSSSESGDTTSSSGTSDEDTSAPLIGPSNLERKEGVYNFLILGKDRIALNTDVMMLITYDVLKNDVSIMQIPRDTYIYTQGTQGTLRSFKINTLYSIGYINAYNSGSKNYIIDGLASATEEIEKAMSVEIDYTFLVNLDGLVNIIDALGGMWIDIPVDMEYQDPEQGLYINLSAGYQFINGNQAEQFVRFRDDFLEGDLGRVKAMQIFLTALAKQIFTSINLNNVDDIVSAIAENVTTVMPLKDMMYFAKNLLKTDMSKIRMITLPGNDARAYVTSGQWYYVLYREDTLEIINTFFNVYTTDITNEMFDPEHKFAGEEFEHVASIYVTPYTGYIKNHVFTAEEIDKNPPRIPTH